MCYQHFLRELHFILFQGPADKGLSLKDDLMMGWDGIYASFFTICDPPTKKINTHALSKRLVHVQNI